MEIQFVGAVNEAFDPAWEVVVVPSGATRNPTVDILARDLLG